MVISLQACNTREKLGAATPDLVVERYLLALETKDLQLMTKLQNEHAVGKATAATIARLGGHKFQQRRVEYLKRTPNLWLAKIAAVYVDRNNQPQNFVDTVPIIYQSEDSWKLYRGRWYLSLSSADLAL